VSERYRDEGEPRRIAIATLGLSATAIFAHVALLARLPTADRALFEPLTRGARIGQLDLDVGLWLDPLGAAAAGLACLCAMGAAIFAPPELPEGEGWRGWTWIHLSLAGALLSFLADGFVPMAIGWALAAGSWAWLWGWVGPKEVAVAATRAALAVVAMLVASVLLFWGLEGGWDGDDFVAETRARFAAVRLTQGGAEPRDSRNAPTDYTGGSLTMTGAAGALVFVDDARRESLRAPFDRVQLMAGAHSFRVHVGHGARDALIDPVSFAGADEIALVPLGPSLVFRAIADQLTLSSPVGTEAVRGEIAGREAPGGVPLVLGAFLACLVAVAALSTARAPGGAPRALVALATGATLNPLGPYLLARLWPLAAVAPRVGALVAAFGAGVMCMGTVRAVRHAELGPRLLAFVVTVPVGLGCVELGLAGQSAFLAATLAAGLCAFGAFLASRKSEGGLIAGGPVAAAPQAPEDWWLRRAPEHVGGLLVGMEQWVLGACARAAAGLARATAWSLATADIHVVSKPGDVAAGCVKRVGHGIESILGASPGRLVWTLFGAAGVAALAHAILASR
jgi:hypothetical protein